MAKRRYKNGLVLIAVLWAVVVLIVIITVVGKNSRLDARVSFADMMRDRCRWAGRAGVETAMAVLNEDYLGSDGLMDLWADNDEDFNDIAVGQSYFTVRVVDEAGKLNVNTASREQLLSLPDMVEEIADAIIDWRDRDDKVTSSGAEAGYYTNLMFGYNIRNAPFKTIRELLKVKGVTEQMLYGEDTNFNNLLDFNEYDGDKSLPLDDGDDELDKGWIEYLSCYSYASNTDAAGNERVNINKADEKELERKLGLDKAAAKWIVEERKKDYKSISDLIDNKSPKKPPRNGGGDSERSRRLDLQSFYDIADKITVDDGKKLRGKVNVNTASKEVLTALAGDDDSAGQIADAIISHRRGQLEGMTSISDLLESGTVKIDTFKKIAKYVTTRSNVFTIYSFASEQSGAVADVQVVTEAVVDRVETPCRVVYWYQGTNN